MKVVQITKNATLKKDGEGLFWLRIQSSRGRYMFNLTSLGDSITEDNTAQMRNEILEAFMNEQQSPKVDSPN